jgi:CheY-like chemotaxis protein
LSIIPFFFTNDIENIDNLLNKADALHVYRIIQEVLNNIVKHANAKEVFVTVEKNHNHIKLSVEDNGNGFDFSEEVNKNVSLGMKTLKERAKIIKSILKITSEQNKGTVVQLEISIIVADDHPMLLKGLFEELTSNGYNVVGKATNGSEALELILKLTPTLAILDIDMPFLRGLEVIKISKGKNIPTKFIIQSFHKETEYILQAKSLKIQGYLLKEDSFNEIERCIKAVLNNKNCFSASLSNSLMLLKNFSV